MEPARCFGVESCARAEALSELVVGNARVEFCVFKIIGAAQQIAAPSRLALEFATETYPRQAGAARKLVPGEKFPGEGGL
jgi:hypothetical protein